MTHPTLPAPVRTFLAAHAERDVDRALTAFTPAPEVVDDGHAYRGADAVRTFVATAGAEFTYTTTLLGTERVDDAVWVVRQRVEGDFPGGVADLAYRFTLAGGLVDRLEITA